MDQLSLAPTPNPESPRVRCTAFAGHRRIASGSIRDVALKTKKLLDKGEEAAILIFNNDTSDLIEIDFRGSAAEVDKRLTTKAAVPEPLPERRGPGRPRLGVVGREVTLLPRHWDWLDDQPGGASVALRKLVESAKRDNRAKDRARHSQEAAHRFMSAMAGNLPAFEEASRAFYGGDQARFYALIQPWPASIRDHAKRLAAAAFEAQLAAREERTPSPI